MSRILLGVAGALLAALVSLWWLYSVQSEALRAARAEAAAARARAAQATSACETALAYLRAGTGARENAAGLKAHLEGMTDVAIPDSLRDLLGGLAGVLRPEDGGEDRPAARP